MLRSDPTWPGLRIKLLMQDLLPTYIISAPTYEGLRCSDSQPGSHYVRKSIFIQKLLLIL
jgi:hypothetical protein